MRVEIYADPRSERERAEEIRDIVAGLLKGRDGNSGDKVYLNVERNED